MKPKGETLKHPQGQPSYSDDYWAMIVSSFFGWILVRLGHLQTSTRVLRRDWAMEN